MTDKGTVGRKPTRGGPIDGLRSLAARMPLWLKLIIAIWVGFGLLFSSVDELSTNTPQWFRILIGIPSLAVTVAIAAFMVLLSGRSVARMLSDHAGKEPEEDPVALYREGLISHPEMMERLSYRGLEDQSGFNFIFGSVMAAIIVAFVLAPKNPDGSVKLAYQIAVFGFVAGVSTFLLWRGVRPRPLKWACWTFLVFGFLWVVAGSLYLLLH